MVILYHHHSHYVKNPPKSFFPSVASGHHIYRQDTMFEYKVMVTFIHIKKQDAASGEFRGASEKGQGIGDGEH